jgi:aspartate/methionine/tyrosine aminotransferase
VLDAAQLARIAALAAARGIPVLSDEIYRQFLYEGEFASIMRLPGMRERTILLDGFSKSYAMTGWRLGWIAGPAALIKLAARMHSQTITSAATFTMIAAQAALNGPQEVVEEMCCSYQARRDFMVKALNEIDGIECRKPEGAFYLMPRFPNSQKTSAELADALLEEAMIASTPGAAFGKSTEGHVRFSIATAMSELERAVERLAKVGPRL